MVSMPGRGENKQGEWGEVTSTSNCTDYQARRLNARYKITVYRKFPHGELFDLEADPGELNNLWDDPASVGVKAELLHEFHQARMQCEPMRMPRIAGA